MANFYCEYCAAKYSSVSSLTAASCTRHPNGSCKGKHSPGLLMIHLMKILDNFKQRVLYEKRLSDNELIESIVKAMTNGVVIEFLYDDYYAYTAPIILKEVENQWCLLGWNNDCKDDLLCIYALNSMKEVDEHWITFSIVDIDYQKIFENAFQKIR